MLSQVKGALCAKRSERRLARIRPIIHAAGRTPASFREPPPCVATEDTDGESCACAADNQGQEACKDGNDQQKGNRVH